MSSVFDDGEKAKWFGAILDAASCEQSMGFDMEERWAFYAKFGCDPYDSSIELYFSPHCPPDWSPSEEDMQFLAGYGVTFGWMNFTDGTEIYFSGSRPSPRKPKNHASWTKKAWFEWYHVGHPVKDEDLASYPAYVALP